MSPYSFPLGHVLLQICLDGKINLVGQTERCDAQLHHDVRQMLPWVDRMSRVSHRHLSLQSRPPAARAPRERPRSATAAMISTSATGT